MKDQLNILLLPSRPDEDNSTCPLLRAFSSPVLGTPPKSLGFSYTGAEGQRGSLTVECLGRTGATVSELPSPRGCRCSAGWTFIEWLLCQPGERLCLALPDVYDTRKHGPVYD